MSTRKSQLTREAARLFARGTTSTSVVDNTVVTVLWPVARLVIVGSNPVTEALESAARLLGQGSRDEAALVLQVPYDGRAWSLKDLLDRLDTLAIPEPAVSVHTPDLDDVFFALTGQPRTGQPAADQPPTDQPGPEQDASR